MTGKTEIEWQCCQGEKVGKSLISANQIERTGLWNFQIRNLIISSYYPATKLWFYKLKHIFLFPLTIGLQAFNTSLHQIIIRNNFLLLLCCKHVLIIKILKIYWEIGLVFNQLIYLWWTVLKSLYLLKWGTDHLQLYSQFFYWCKPWEVSVT